MGNLDPSIFEPSLSLTIGLGVAGVVLVAVACAVVISRARSSAGKRKMGSAARDGVRDKPPASSSTASPADGHASSEASTHATSGRRPRRFTRDPYISVVIPCYNEEGNIQAMHERLSRAIAPLTSTYELIFVNNGSYDDSATLLDALAATDEYVTVLTLSRNFGSQGAYTSGMEYASGDCVICLDGDIQDPPELIPTFVDRWREGYDVIYGVRVRRKGSLLRRIGYKAFYRLLHKVSYIQVPIDAGDFGLMDRRVVDAMNAMPERSRLIRGLRAWVGFHQVGVPYTRDERFSGTTTNSIRGLFRWASLGIISFSFAPLDLISYLAAFVVGLSAIALVVYTALYFIVPNAPRGFETLLVVTLFLGAVQLLCLSIIGTYLARMFEEIKARPKYLIQDVQNDHRIQQASTIRRQASAEIAAAGSGAIEHPPVATVSNTAAARAPLD